MASIFGGCVAWNLDLNGQPPLAKRGHGMYFLPLDVVDARRMHNQLTVH